jgi:hypothetical protein
MMADCRGITMREGNGGHPKADCAQHLGVREQQLPPWSDPQAPNETKAGTRGSLISDDCDGLSVPREEKRELLLAHSKVLRTG